MGFFSAVKKFFGQKGSDEEAEKKEVSADAVPESAPDGSTEPEALENEPADEHGQRESLSARAGEQAEPTRGLPPDAAEKLPEAQPDDIPAGPGDEATMVAGGETVASEAAAERAALAAREMLDMAGLPDTLAEELAPEIGAGAAVVSPHASGETGREGESEGAPARSGQDSEEARLIARLREAEPRLSLWLDIILEGQEEADERFWRRLRFLLRSLEAPEAEAEAFLGDFGQWLRRMDYAYVDEFRSELQYRLALALDLEDEEDERNRLLLKLSQGLAATREKLGMGLHALFSGHGELNDAFWEELEELFIMADLGYDTALEIVARLKRRAARKNVAVAADVGQLLQEELEDIFRQEPKIRAVNKPEVVLMMGVNGAGKTTTIAKLAHRERMVGRKVLVAAADTFRAAAIEQLQVWAERAGADFYARPAGSDPASVAWGAMDYALENGIDIVFVDTAGRLQTRVNLMEELGKIRQVLAKKHKGAPHRSVLVLDATTGQNALSQARLFREAAGADELILTKLDGTAKGGVAIAVAMQEKLPITYIGLGEKMDDLRPFHGADFARALLGEGEESAKEGS